MATKGPMIPVHRYIYVDPLWLDARDAPEQQPLKKKPLKEARRHVIRSPPPSREGGSRGGMSVGGLAVGGLPRVDKRRPPALPTEKEHGGDRRQYSYLLLHTNAAEDVSMLGSLPTKYSTLWGKQDKRPREKVRARKGNRSTQSLNLGASIESDGSDREDLSKALLIRGSTSEGQYDPSGSRWMPFNDDSMLPPISAPKKKHVVAPMTMRSSDDWPELPPGFSHSFSQGPAPALSVERPSAGSQFDSTHMAYSPRLPTSVFSPGSTGNSWRGSANRPPTEWNDQLLRIMPISEWEVRQRKRPDVQASLNSSYMSSSGGQSADEFERDPLDPFPFSSFSMDGYGMGREQRSFSFVESPQLRRCRTAPDVTAAARLADPGLSMKDATDDLHVRRMSLSRRGADGPSRSRRRKRSKRQLREYTDAEGMPFAQQRPSVQQEELLSSAISAGWDRRSEPSKPSLDERQSVSVSEQTVGRLGASSQRASVPASERETLGRDSSVIQEDDERASGSASMQSATLSDGRKSSSSASGPQRSSQRHLEGAIEEDARGSRRSIQSSASSKAGPSGGSVAASSSADGRVVAASVGGSSLGPAPKITINTVAPEAAAVVKEESPAASGSRPGSPATEASHVERSASKRGGGDLALMSRRAHGHKPLEAEWATDVGGKGLDLRPHPSASPDAQGASAAETNEGNTSTATLTLSSKRRPQQLTVDAIQDPGDSPASPTSPTSGDLLDTLSESLDPALRAERRIRDRSKQVMRSRSRQPGDEDDMASPRSQADVRPDDSASKTEQSEEDEELYNKLLAKQKQREEHKQREKEKEEMMKRRKSKRAPVGGTDHVVSAETEEADNHSKVKVEVETQDSKSLEGSPQTRREGSSLLSQLSQTSSKNLGQVEEEEESVFGSVQDSPVSSLSTLDEPPLFKAVMKGRDLKPAELLLPGHRLEAMGHVPTAHHHHHHHKHGPQVAGEESSGSSTPTTVELWDEAGHLLFWDAADPNRLAGQFRDALTQVWTETPEPQTPESEREAREWDQLLAMPVPRSEELWQKVQLRLPEISLQGMLRNVSKAEPAEEQSQEVITETLHEVYSKMNVKRYLTKMEGRTKAEVDLLLQKQPGGAGGPWSNRLTSCKRQLGTLHVFTKGHRAAVRA
mmetsp:Transcript_44189/g.102043  ORF Transcript_44189/g.102043 Transcript_44189/m.102043 type:complete len:1145 (-) Transcript_44189:131-3565(-)